MQNCSCRTIVAFFENGDTAYQVNKRKVMAKIKAIKGVSAPKAWRRWLRRGHMMC
jgi:hypothetical protein